MVASMDEVLRRIAEAFAEAPRPTDEELLHERCFDDNDLRSLYGIPHWREVPEAVVEYEYAALFFLSPAGFRHFLPAYLSWVLRHPDSGAAVVDSTLMALMPASEFGLSKFTLLDGAQRAAVAAFLEAMADFVDVDEGLEYWRSSREGG